MDRNVHFSTLEPRSPRNSQAYPPQEIWKIIYIYIYTYIHIYLFIFYRRRRWGRFIFRRSNEVLFVPVIFLVQIFFCFFYSRRAFFFICSDLNLLRFEFEQTQWYTLDAHTPKRAAGPSSSASSLSCSRSWCCWSLARSQGVVPHSLVCRGKNAICDKHNFAIS